MSRAIKLASTDQSTVIRIVDSADGTPEEGVTSATSGLSLWYRRNGGSTTAITPSDLAAQNSAHSDGGLKHLDDGYYRLDLPDAACASGATDVIIGGTATGMVVIGAQHALVAFDPQDTVRLGLTSLPNAAADGAGGLPISDAGGLDLDTFLGRLDAAITSRLAPTTAGRTLDVTAGGAAGVDWGNVENASTTVDLSGTSVKNVTESYLRRNTAQAGTANTITLDAGASATDNFYRGLLVAILSGTGAGQARYVSGYTGSTREADVDPNWSTNPSSDSVFQLLAWSPALNFSGADLATANSVAALNLDVTTIRNAVDTEVAAILEDTGTTIPALISALNNLSAAQVNAEVVDVIRTDTLSELGVGAPAATPTVATALMLLYMALRNAGVQTATEFRIANDAGTTICEADVSDDGTSFTRSELRAP